MPARARSRNFLLALPVRGGRRGADVTVQATRDGEAVGWRPCRVAVAHGTRVGSLTDYRPALPIRTSIRPESRVVSRDGGITVVEQKGEARFLF